MASKIRTWSLRKKNDVLIKKKSVLDSTNFLVMTNQKQQAYMIIALNRVLFHWETIWFNLVNEYCCYELQYAKFILGRYCPLLRTLNPFSPHNITYVYYKILYTQRHIQDASLLVFFLSSFSFIHSPFWGAAPLGQMTLIHKGYHLSYIIKNYLDGFF